tara:strand:- start:332 stop:613 length:282 start_codon:yes stop_codon:yes gene_type:complete
MPTKSTITITLGFVLIIHAAYSSSHYRALLASLGLSPSKIAEKSPPIDACLEVLAGFLTCLFGSLLQIGSLEPVLSTKDTPKREIVPPAYRTR